MSSATSSSGTMPTSASPTPTTSRRRRASTGTTRPRSPDPENSPQEILRQHWYAHQLSQLGELIAEEHGGTDTALKLAYVVDEAGVEEMEEQLEEAEADPPAFLLESRYDLQDAEECLTPPEGMDTEVPLEDQNCYEIDFEIIQGEANDQAPYFHWTEFETADGEEAGFWDRSAVHWL